MARIKNGKVVILCNRQIKCDSISTSVWFVIRGPAEIATLQFMIFLYLSTQKLDELLGTSASTNHFCANVMYNSVTTDELGQNNNSSAASNVLFRRTLKVVSMDHGPSFVTSYKFLAIGYILLMFVFFFFKSFVIAKCMLYCAILKFRDNLCVILQHEICKMKLSVVGVIT